MWCGKIITSIIFILYAIPVATITPTKYMSIYCKRNIYVNSSLILELTNDLLEESEPTENVHCSAKVVTETGFKLLLHFITLDISYHGLTPDRLHIYDYDKNGKGSRVSPIAGLYGVYDEYYRHTSVGVHDYLSSSNTFRIDYMGKPTILYRGFRILVTSVKDPNSDGSCTNYYSRCSKGSICIPTTTWCNGDNNCGDKDDSDEKNCNWVLSTGLEEKYAIGNIVTSSVLSCLAFIAVVVVVFGVIFRYNRRSYLRRQSITVHAAKNGNGKWKITNDMGLTAQIYAPPTYDDVVAVEEHETEEPPPAYESLPCSVRNSCELGQSQNGSVTIVCIESRDIHLYNEGTHVPNVRCFAIRNDDENYSENSENDASDPPSGTSASGSRSDSGSTHSSKPSSGSLQSMNSEQNDDDNESKSVTRHLLPSSSNRKTDSNDNLVRPKIVGVVDDEIEYIDDEDL